jgi:CRISPR/Cas system Type II protein with McrA/HNH and RuvC-like nuclease domain
MMIKNILGLDLGTNSIGWALINKILKISMAKFWEWEAELSQCHRIF